MSPFLRTAVLFALTPLGLARAIPASAQTVIRDSSPPPAPAGAPAPNGRPATDSARARTAPTYGGARADSANRAAAPTPGVPPGTPGAAPAPAAAPGAGAPAPAAPAPTTAPAAPAPPLATDAAPKGVCSNTYGGVSTDVLLVTFARRSTPADRQAAIKSVQGTLVAPDPNDDASAYVRVASDGNEYLLRTFADRLIRVRAVKEVSPAPCPGSP